MIYLKPKLIVSVFEKAILRREVPFALDCYAVLPGEHLMAVKHDSPFEPNGHEGASSGSLCRLAFCDRCGADSRFDSSALSQCGHGMRRYPT